jgi:hypothetical protein
MKALVLAATLAIAAQAIAGEDSTHRWGAGGTGPAWYDTPCGLANFPGPVSPPDPQRCSVAPRTRQHAATTERSETAASPAERESARQDRPASSKSN